MSRRHSAANANARPEGHSRRSVIAGAAASPAFVVTTKPEPNQCIQACENWLRLNAEHDRLARRWAKLEARLARECDYLKLGDEHQRQLPQAQELFVIDELISCITNERDALLKILPTLAATSALGLAGKLAVAAIQVDPEDHAEAHWLIASVLRDLNAMRPSDT